jgi:hypothetical protein
MLLEACSSSGSDSGPAAVANTAAPQLIASWETDCIITENSGSTSTVTSASGGSGGGSISGGEAFRTAAVFRQDGHVEFTTEYYATANCNANTLAGLGRYNAVYYVGDTALANDGSPVTAIDISDSTNTTYSIFQVVADSELYLGETAASSTGNDGDTEATRHDGLGARMLKQ